MSALEFSHPCQEEVSPWPQTDRGYSVLVIDRYLRWSDKRDLSQIGVMDRNISPLDRDLSWIDKGLKLCGQGLKP